MFKILFILVLATILADIYGQRINRPMYRIPIRRGPMIRRGRDTRNCRDTGNSEPLWLYKDDVPRAPASGDHPELPNNIDDIKLDPNTRYARSVDSPSAQRSSGSDRGSSSGRDTGATHPGYNRRNARAVRPSFASRQPIRQPMGRGNTYSRPGMWQQRYPGRRY